MTTLPEKLGFEAGARVLLISAPKAVREELAAVDHGAKVSQTGRGPFDVVFGFVARKREVARLFKQAQAVLASPGSLWIAYPAKSSAVATDLDRKRGWSALRERGWMPVARAAIDETWEALRFAHDPALWALNVTRRLERAEESPTVKIKKGSETKRTVKLRRDVIEGAAAVRRPRREAKTVSMKTRAGAVPPPSPPPRPRSSSNTQTAPERAAVVRAPADLLAALGARPAAKKRWGRLSPARKKQLLAVIDEVQTAPARARRIERVVGELDGR